MTGETPTTELNRGKFPGYSSKAILFTSNRRGKYIKSYYKKEFNFFSLKLYNTLFCCNTQLGQNGKYLEHKFCEIENLRFMID